MTGIARSNKNIMLVAALILSINLLIYMICMPIFVFAEGDRVEMVAIMYHNVVPDDTHSAKYEIMAKDLERDLAHIKKLGYRVVVPSDLYAYQRGEISLPTKVVMLTFDDGYYSYIKYLLPLLDRYDMKAVVSVVGEYTAYNKNNKDTSPRYTYLDYEDIKALADSGRVEIGLHSYAMHHIKNGYQGVIQHKGESYDDYRTRLLKDTNKLTNALSKIGIKSSIYTYPYGSFVKASDEILKEVGIKMTLSCNEGINYLTPTSSLYRIKRYNRDGRLSNLSELCPFFRMKK